VRGRDSGPTISRPWQRWSYRSSKAASALSCRMASSSSRSAIVLVPSFTARRASSSWFATICFTAAAIWGLVIVLGAGTVRGADPDRGW
jgi:hypothetical protein